MPDKRYIKMLHDVVLPALLEHDSFTDALVDAVERIPITELSAIASELPKGKHLTIGTLPEAANNLRANTITEMIVTLKDTVEAYATLKGDTP